MPPVKPVASSTDVDNDATAELPVLDVAAYEATLDDSSLQHRHLDGARPCPRAIGAVVRRIRLGGQAIPTLLPAD